ncbi:hypothetical protein [Paenibacillus tundrae]|uniref:hypothetical protein n=1 Tax=Paenibacillus tundrae TaxID=528187 RepID=UPI0030D14B82
MEKRRVIQFGERNEQYVIEEGRRMENNRLDLVVERSQVHNQSTQMNNSNHQLNETLEQKHDLWKSRLLKNQVRKQPWFIKLQEHRNEI